MIKNKSLLSYNNNIIIMSISTQRYDATHLKPKRSLLNDCCCYNKHYQ